MSCEGGLICVRFEAGLLALSGSNGDAHVDANEDALVLQVSIGNVGQTKLRHGCDFLDASQRAVRKGVFVGERRDLAVRGTHEKHSFTKGGRDPSRA
jgi:hypothetical protein